tara:strand:- start:107 stop:637 length:531 start_codon:yes stop_codon:yes gene_type:complete
MKTSIIGLAGPSTVGKSTIARRLKSIFSSGSPEGEIHSFASNIRLALYVMGLEVNYEDKEAPVYKDKSTRDLMKSLGTEWGRNSVGLNIWVDLLMQRIDKSDAPAAIIDDVRFANEAQAIRNRGGIVIELSREGVQYNGAHATELGLDKSLVDATVDCGCVETAVNEILDIRGGSQ